MQRKFSEPNTYIDGLPSQDRPDLLYDDVEMSELTATVRTRGGRGRGAGRPVFLPPNLNPIGHTRSGFQVTCRATRAEIQAQPGRLLSWGGQSAWHGDSSG